jgi:Family of unknown function (DUF6496)
MANLDLVAASTMPLRPQTSAFLCGHRLAEPKPTGRRLGTIIALEDYFVRNQGGKRFMARKYSKQASADVERAMKKRKAGTLKSGRSAKKVTSRKQAIAIGLSEARAEGKKVPKKSTAKKAAKKKSKAKKSKR